MTDNPPELYALITGASSGLGRAIAVRFSSRCKLILSGRDSERLHETRSMCLNPDRHLLWQYDLSGVRGLAECLSAFICDRQIAIGSFIHSAGLLKILPARSVTYETCEEILNTNLVSAVEIISTLVKRRINQGHLKNILFVSSIASNFGAPGFSMYAASKSALDGLMRALAVELAPNIRVNSILPGGFRTPMTESLLNDPVVLEKFLRDYPLGIGKIEDIVNAVEFMASENARWITGQQIVVDGGRSVNIAI